MKARDDYRTSSCLKILLAFQELIGTKILIPGVDGDSI